METHITLTFKTRTSKSHLCPEKKQRLPMNITNRTKTSSHCSAERNFKNVELHTELGDFWMKSAHPAILKGSSCHCFHRKISLYLKSLFKLVQLQLELALQAELFWSLALRNKPSSSPSSMGCLQGAQQKKISEEIWLFEGMAGLFTKMPILKSSFRGNKTLFF